MIMRMSATGKRLAAGLALLLGLALLPACASIPFFSGGDEVAKAHYSRHLTFRAQDQLDKAAVELELAIKADPNMYHAYYQLGLIRQSQDQKEMARLIFQQGIDAARKGPERDDYPRTKSLAELESALASLEPLPPLVPMAPPPSYRPPAKPSVKGKTYLGKKAKPVKPSKFKIPKGSRTGPYAVLVSSNKAKASADGDVRRLKAAGIPADVTTYKSKKGTWYRVWAGCCSGHDKAVQLASTLKRKGLASSPAVMKR